MSNSKSSLAVIVLSALLTTSTGCSGGRTPGESGEDVTATSTVKLAKEGPQKADIEQALQDALSEVKPSPLQLKSLVIEAQESVGSEIDPAYGVRFQAAAELPGDLVELQFKFLKTKFAKVTVPKGTKIELYGKIVSSRSQGAWEHEVEFDKKPLADFWESELLQPNAVIMGSESETQLLEKWRQEGRITAAPNVEQLLLGQWECAYNVKKHFTQDGVFRFNRQVGTWNLYKGKLLFLERPGDFNLVWGIEAIDDTSLKLIDHYSKTRACSRKSM